MKRDFRNSLVKSVPVMLLVLIVISCKLFSSFGGSNSNGNRSNSATATPSSTVSPAETPDENSKEPAGENLLSLSTGAFVVKASSVNHTYNNFNEFSLIDDHVGGYGDQLSKEGETSGEYVIALPERVSLDTIEMWGHDFGHDNAKDVELQMSDVSEDTGFESIMTATLDAPTQAKRSTFPVSKKVAGRWLKVILKNNHGGKYVSISEIRGYGQRLTQTPIHDISGTYATDLHFGNGRTSKIFLKQTGTSVEGCVSYTNPIDKSVLTEQLLVDGAMINNGLMLFTQQLLTKGLPEKGDPAIFVFSPDHKRIYAQINHSETSSVASIGTKLSDDVGACPQWTVKTNSLADELEQSGRIKLYGITFATDSDVITAESFAMLDKLVEVAKAKPDWKFGIEGHTDSVADDDHNQKLSEKRAAAVKAYLIKAGISADRLDSVGFGESKPIADNSSEIGRAQNRRVEIVRK